MCRFFLCELFSLLRQNSYANSILAIVLIILVGILISHSWIFVNGYLKTADTVTLRNHIGMVDNLKAGIFPPAWNPNPAGGSGEAFYFWPPFVPYVVAIINVFEPNIFKAMDLMVAVIWIASGLTFFLLAKKITNMNFVALISSIVYMCTPYHFTEFMDRGDFGEAAAFIFFPLLVYFMLEIRKKNRSEYFKPLILGGISFGLLLITHLLVAYMFLWFIFLPFVAYFTIKDRNPKKILPYLGILVVGVIVTTFYWMPVVLEKDEINWKFYLTINLDRVTLNIGTMLFNQKWDYSSYAHAPQQDYSMWFLGYPAVAAIVIGSIFFYRNKSILLLVILSSIIVFMIAREGLPLFKLIPLSEHQQFTFRSLTTVSLITSILFSLVLRKSYLLLHDKLSKIKNIDRILVYGLTGILLSFILITSYHLGDVKYSIVDNPTVEQMCCYYPDLPTFLPNTITGNYWGGGTLTPRFPWQIVETPNLHGERDALFAKIHPLPLYVMLQNNTDNDNPIHMKIKTSIQRWDIFTNNTAEHLISFRLFYYPSWHVFIDGQKQLPTYDLKTGYITVTIPSGNHHVEIVWTDSTVRYYAKIISLISIISIFVILLFRIYRKRDSILNIKK